jgi:hypothetical protein
VAYTCVFSLSISHAGRLALASFSCCTPDVGRAAATFPYRSQPSLHIHTHTHTHPANPVYAATAAPAAAAALRLISARAPTLRHAHIYMLTTQTPPELVTCLSVSCLCLCLAFTIIITCLSFGRSLSPPRFVYCRLSHPYRQNSSRYSVVRSEIMADDNELSMKDIIALVPPFVAPARVWAAKISMLFPGKQPQHLMEITKTRLPAHIFERVAESKFETVKQLLDKIIQLEETPSWQAAQQLFAAPSSISDGQLPSDQFRETLRTTRIALPACPEQQARTIAWQKTLQCLPSQMQQTLLLTQPDAEPTDKLLDFVDNACRHQRSTIANTQVAQTWSVAEETTKVLHRPSSSVTPSSGADITERLDSLEAAIRALGAHSSRPFPPERRQVSGDEPICWFHTKFGAQALKCTPPCRFHQRPAKGRGATTPY